MNEYKVLHLFCGIGGAALGFQEARAEYRGMVGRFRTLAGIDCDAEACQDFEALTGAPAVQMDLFSHQDYIAFHGTMPPADWQEVEPIDILEATQVEHPDVVFLSPPCKGFSGLLPSEKSKSEKYQALNRLVVRGLQLVIDAYMDKLPAVIMLENVPRITSRGEFLLRQVKKLLGAHGYVFHEGSHDCGELGGLAQHRKRYLLIARHPEKMTSFIYRPPRQKVKAIGEVIGPLPMPDDPTMGPMHRLPRLQVKTWVRLALIPAGGDWRNLQDCGNYSIEHITRDGSWQVAPWDNPAGTVVGHARVGHSNGVAAISDPRLPDRENRHPGVYQVVKWDEAGPCVTGTRFGSGAPAVSDPRAVFKDSTHHSIYRVRDWNKPANTVTGADGPHNGAITVADPRLSDRNNRRNNSYMVRPWEGPAHTITGEDTLGSGAQSIADPRVEKFNHSYRVTPWDETAGTVTSGVSPSNGAVTVADPRLGCSPRNGTMGVQDWGKPAGTVIGAGDIHAGAAAVADPRLPDDHERPDPPPIIISLDGTWHRPLTTLELAILQSLDPIMPDGRPLQLAGNSDARWRERIGNMVPKKSAKAIGEEILISFLASKVNDEWRLSASGIWVHYIEGSMPALEMN